MQEVKDQLLKCKVDTMFQENLSAKMKEIRKSRQKKFNELQKVIDIDR